MRNAPGVSMGRAFDEGEATGFWLLRDRPDAEQAAVHTKEFASPTRHALYARRGGPRSALVSCSGGCVHGSMALARLALDLTAPEPPAKVPAPPAFLPGAPGVSTQHRSARETTVTRHGSSMRVSWAKPRTWATEAALTAFVLRLVLYVPPVQEV
ncbi:hypothetical protein OHB04_40310 (plasmid) [Streptomyces sp. NBC_01775]|uniref:hypothetical protein n=1 Tax=Streptomyces sp. NBC_01775 TaxID=2975939 RepID=UPI002DDB8CD6|nr:hypothetical protein [Streptomyces sp. NBC_01775]WSB81981.1 hypothetical protein OHB04_40310 [Streptomyces sp. NBC_01775]